MSCWRAADNSSLSRQISRTKSPPIFFMSGSHGFAALSNAVSASAVAIFTVRLPEVRRAETKKITQHAGILIFQREKFCAAQKMTL